MGSLFSSQDYVLYRFEYPETIFHPLRPFLQPALRKHLKILDLGCGTGLVAESFLKFYSRGLEMHLADPDVKMLGQAQKQFESEPKIHSMVCASSDVLPFSDESFDIVLIGSAWHWMNPEKSLEEIGRVLKPGGGVFIFEYQFPKAIENSELNNWIRIQFNSEWKPTTQKPRGSLKEITECWRSHTEFSQLYSGVVSQDRSHDSHELAGVIVSQSRYQHYELLLHESDRSLIRTQLESKLAELMKSLSAEFRYGYEGYFFKKRL